MDYTAKAKTALGTCRICSKIHGSELYRDRAYFTGTDQTADRNGGSGIIGKWSG